MEIYAHTVLSQPPFGVRLHSWLSFYSSPNRDCQKRRTLAGLEMPKDSVRVVVGSGWIFLGTGGRRRKRCGDARRGARPSALFIRFHEQADRDRERSVNESRNE